MGYFKLLLSVILGAALIGYLQHCITKQRDERQFASIDPSPDMKDASKPMVMNHDDLQWLVGQSPFIFIGKLVEQKTSRDQNGMIFTSNIFEIRKAIAGTYDGKKIDIRTLGGELDGKVMKVSHMPVFYRGIEYLLFTDPARQTYSPVTANEAGVFIINAGLMYRYSGQSLIGIEKTRLITGFRKAKLPAEGKSTEEKRLVTTPPETSTPELKIKTFDEAELLRSERPLSLDAFIEYIQRFAN